MFSCWTRAFIMIYNICVWLLCWMEFAEAAAVKLLLITVSVSRSGPLLMIWGVWSRSSWRWWPAAPDWRRRSSWWNLPSSSAEDICTFTFSQKTTSMLASDRRWAQIYSTFTVYSWCFYGNIKIKQHCKYLDGVDINNSKRRFYL